MPTEQSADKQKTDNKDAAVKPDAETMNTTDPQEHMEGPLSSLMQKIGGDADNEESVEISKKDTDD